MVISHSLFCIDTKDIDKILKDTNIFLYLSSYIILSPAQVKMFETALGFNQWNGCKLETTLCH